MSKPLDKRGMILALTEGVGVSFGSATRKSFYVQLDRLEKLPRFRKAVFAQKQSLIDLLAVAAFYQNIIVPIESSGSFIPVLNKAGATHLRVAKDRLGKAFANRSLVTAHSFRQILSQSAIPEQLLTYATMDRFVTAAVKHYLEAEK